MLSSPRTISRTITCLAVLTCAGLVFAGAAVAEDAGQGVTGEELVEWARRNAVELETLDWQQLDMATLSFLDGALKGKRIVYLGEADHFVNEKSDFAMILIRYLVEHGCGTIGMEIGYADCKRMDRYIETGDEAHLADVAWKGMARCGRPDRDDRVTAYKAMGNKEFVARYEGQVKWLLDQLRILNAHLPEGEPRIRFFGFDVTMFPWCGYEDASALLQGRGSDPLIAELHRRLKLRGGETRLEEAQRLHDTVKFCEQNKAKLSQLLGPGDARELQRILWNLADSYEFTDAAVSKDRSAGWLSALSKREMSMGRLMSDLLDHELAGEKIIMLGHVLHLSKDSDSICLGPVGSGYPAMWLSIGTQLERKRPGEIYSMWFTYDHGRHGNILLPGAFEDVPSDPARFESLLARALDGPYILPLRNRTGESTYLDKPRNFLQNGQTASALIKRQADAIFFVAQATALSARPPGAKAPQDKTGANRHSRAGTVARPQGAEQAGGAYSPADN